jgi:transcriptional regulator with XRE-family HTH domain
MLPPLVSRNSRPSVVPGGRIGRRGAWFKRDKRVRLMRMEFGSGGRPTWSTLFDERQEEVSKRMSFGKRLAEERKRLGLKQAEFADLVGTDVPKQSLYENDRRELRADYLARLAQADVDIVYVLTGRRNEGEWLGQGPSELLTCYFALPPDMQQAVQDLAHALRDQFGRPAGATVHTRGNDLGRR